MQILVFGASITWGAFDLEGGGWVERLKLHYFQSFEENRVHVYNLGVSGQTTDDLLRRFKHEVEERIDSNPQNNILLFCIGANDAAFITDKNAFRVPPERYCENMGEIIRLGKQYANTIGILPVTPVDETSPHLLRNGKVRKNEYVDTYNAQIKNISQKLEVDYIDIHESLKDKGSAIFDKDGLHPNSLGHKLIFEEALHYLKDKAQ